MSQTHIAKEITILKAAVDEKIIPVVQWLNSFEGVITIFSCEGDKKVKPYILFQCDEHLTLLRILKTARAYYKTCEVWWWEDHLPVRYRMEFLSHGDMLVFVNYLTK